MVINASTKTLCLLGQPVSHSFSPAIHNAISTSLNLNYVYVAHNVNNNEVENALKGLNALKYTGANVTVPHKSAIIPFLDEIQEEAQIIGAVNTIHIRDNLLIGYNTDCYGFIEMLKDEGVSLNNKNVLLMGAGGAARAVVAAAILNQANSISICSRTIEKSEQYVNTFEGALNYKGQFQALTYDLLNEKAHEFDIIVNCTPLGMHPNEGKTPVNPDIFSKSSVLVDLIYNPAQTAFLKAGQEKDMKTINGLGMLIHQALEAYRIWTGQTQTAEFVKEALRKEGIIL